MFKEEQNIFRVFSNEKTIKQKLSVLLEIIFLTFLFQVIIYSFFVVIIIVGVIMELGDSKLEEFPIRKNN